MEGIVGNYKVKTKIYETDDKAIYKAESFKDDRYYVIKEYKDKQYQEQFDEEIRITAEIEKSARRTIVIPVVDKVDNKYLVMEYKHQGMFLNEYMSSLSMKKNNGMNNLLIIRELIKSLQILHTCGGFGYVHMDIHPGNIFLENIDLNENRIGVVRLLDFGEAISTKKHMNNGRVKNHYSFNLHYTAPEVVMDLAHAISVKADIYSVAVISKELYQPTNRVMKCIFDMFLEPGLCRDKDYRYASCKEMLQNLEQVIDAEQSLMEKRYFDVLSIGYKNMISVSNMVFDNIIDQSSFIVTLEKLEACLNSYQPDTNHCLYVYEGLRQMMNRCKDLSSDIVRRVYLAGIACHNHTGNALKSIELYEKIDLSQLDLFSLIKLRGRVAVSYADVFQSSKTSELLEANISLMKDLSSTIKRISKKADTRYLGSKDLGRAYSAMGTCLQVTDRIADSEKYYKLALQEFAHDPGNKEITMIHLLQYAAASGNQILYQKYENEVFGNGKGSYINDLKSCVSRKQQVNLDYYRILTALKAIYRFTPDLGNEQNVLVDTMKAIKRCGRNTFRHPVELIWKYLGLLVSNDNRRKECFEASIHCIRGADPKLYNRFSIITAINYKTLWTYYSLIGDIDKCESINRMVLEHAQRDGYHIFADLLKEKKSIGNISMGEND